MVRRRLMLVLLVAVLLSVSSYTVLAQTVAPATHSLAAPRLKMIRADLVDIHGNEVGQVEFVHDEAGGIVVSATITDLEQGYYTFGIYSVGSCDAKGDQAFGAVGEREVMKAYSFTDPYGGLLPIYIMWHGRGEVKFVTDRVTFDMLYDEIDGSSLLVQALPEIDTSTAAHTALVSNEVEGERVACGVLSPE